MAYIPLATAPQVEPFISSLSFYENRNLFNNNKFHKFIMEGKYKDNFKEWPELKDWRGILYKAPSMTYIQVINFGSLIGDSSKLRELDRILKEKKKNNDKVLIFCQMTKMIDILEDFMNLRKYTFFRLDGASNIADRRDMVNDFQKPSSKVFVFLLSTRAGKYYNIQVDLESLLQQLTLSSSTITTGIPQWTPKLQTELIELVRAETSMFINW